MVRIVSLGLVLFVLWLLLSGFLKPLLVGFGIASALFVAWIAQRMDVVDREGHPIHLTARILFYWPWLFWEIVKANVDVARRILSPQMAISPTLVRVPTSQRSELGHVIYANSITLTPGTVSLDLKGDTIEVHALSREGAESLLSGEMDRRVTDFEGHR